MRKPVILFVCLTIMLVTQVAGARDSSGKFLVGARGGLCYSMGNSSGSDAEVDGRFGVGLSAEYFVTRPFSVGLTLVYSTFEGEWEKSGYYAGWETWYYTDWDWTNVSLFGKFVMAPREEVSPYFTAGFGAYSLETTHKWYNHPDTVHTGTWQGGPYFGIHLGCGVHYFISRRTLVFVEIPLSLIKTDDFVPSDGVPYHRYHDRSQVLNVFVGLSFLLGSEKQAKERIARS